MPDPTQMSLSTDVPSQELQEIEETINLGIATRERNPGFSKRYSCCFPKTPLATGLPPLIKNTAKPLPPPVMLRITDSVRSQMKIITDKYRKLRSLVTGEFIKLYTDDLDQYHELLHFERKS
ncbi:hypothetical protein TNIN_345351 [Trichonephila inaurata madagascariensis]|uniref:Uncharacterized protein n=1 Tax=Trichonephila inaurata madagascariensis TaxID=2747483 RepID=A0A8X6MCC5_9ARAC|nr:hypothetical protein TNIN_345351 [Trichonephila inaurata madagascariensis]